MKGSLQQRCGKYYAVLRVNGKQKWVHLGISTARGNKRKAEAALNSLLTQYNDNPHMFDKIEFVDYIQKWLKNVKCSIDIVTYEGYQQYAEKHIIPYFKSKNLMLQDVSISDIEGYYNFKASGGRLDGKSGGLSLRTIKLHGVVLSLVFKQAIYEKLIRDNPCVCAKYPVSNISAPKTKISFYTESQCTELLKAVKDTPLYAMVYITLIYGLRRSEMLGLKWDAVDFNDNTITICRTVVLQNEIIRKDKTKNESSKRTYPLLPAVRSILEKMFTQQTSDKALFGNCYCDTGYIFVKQDGSTYYPSYPSHQLSKVLKANNLSHIRWHDLRHSTASILIDKGWGMKQISDWLGHSDITVTMNCYGHISMEAKRQLGKTLDNTFDI